MKFIEILSNLKSIFSLRGKDVARPSGAAQIMEEYAIQTKRIESLLQPTEERSRTLEFMLQVAEQKLNSLEELVRTTEERSRTLEYLSQQLISINTYQIEQLHRQYIELMLSNGKQLSGSQNTSGDISISTQFPIAILSNDHLKPDSTIEGISRPTLFVHDCMRELGADMRMLDLGCGAAGLVYEFTQNKVLAVGVDGSDFCRRNGIGYWPLLDHQLFTSDITKPLSFNFKNDVNQMDFDLITMWEVLEHISVNDMPGLFKNIYENIKPDGYFIGSVSQVPYEDDEGVPYHVTLESKDWWKSTFQNNGFVMLEKYTFNEQFFCRGNGPRYQDFHNYSSNPEDGFWFVAKKV